MYTAVLHVSFCNTTGESLNCIVQAKWLSSCGIVSQLIVTALDFKLVLHGIFYSQTASNLSAVILLL